MKLKRRPNDAFSPCSPIDEPTGPHGLRGNNLAKTGAKGMGRQSLLTHLNQ
jgi:hypothetical protein